MVIDPSFPLNPAGCHADEETEGYYRSGAVAPSPGQKKEPSMMEKCTCQRCFQEEGIPTHQFVKFDEKVQYLCRQCWEGFRRWFHWGQNDQRDRQLELF